MGGAEGVWYWDASAILSVLARDTHTEDARGRLAPGIHHLVSSLAHAEVMAVLARVEREKRAATKDVARAREAFGGGPWSKLAGAPRRETTEALSRRHPLRGAALWHLAMATCLRTDLPELRLLTYDARLAEASKQEGLSCVSGCEPLGTCPSTWKAGGSDP